MKFTPTILCCLLTFPTAQAAITYTETFSSGLGEFEALSNTNTDTSSGALEFENPNGQGAGGTLELDQDGVLGSSFTNLVTDSSGASTQTLYFQFDTFIPTPSGANDELGFFFGPTSNQAQSSNLTDGQTTNGFTLYFNDGNLVIPNNNQGPDENDTSSQNVNLLSDLGIGSEITISIEWSLVPAQNGGQYNNVFTVNAVGEDAATGSVVSATQTFNGAVNQGSNNINSYQFTASTTQGLTGTLDNFTVSDMPIPEPSTLLFTLLGATGIFWRRRHA